MEAVYDRRPCFQEGEAIDGSRVRQKAMFSGGGRPLMEAVYDRRPCFQEGGIDGIPINTTEVSVLIRGGGQLHMHVLQGGLCKEKECV